MSLYVVGRGGATIFKVGANQFASEASESFLVLSPSLLTFLEDKSIISAHLYVIIFM